MLRKTRPSVGSRATAKAITGRDRLAVQAVSEHLDTGLLPGLTNVTGRARGFGFYPWFVWAFDKRSKKKNAEELVRLFRKAECLHTLIGIVHELDEGDEWAHVGGLVGRDTRSWQLPIRPLPALRSACRNTRSWSRRRRPLPQA